MRVIYEPGLGLEGTIEELVDWANRYTSDYSDPALERISELAKEEKLDEKYIRIPLLLKDERNREYSEEKTLPYERMKIDWYIYDKISYSESCYGEDNAELEIWSENNKVLISIYTADWSAAGVYSIEDFMNGDENWLESAIGQIIFYGSSPNVE